MKKATGSMFSLENSHEEDSSVGCGCCMNNHPRLDNFFGSMTDESTMHGVKYIGSKKQHLVERIFWIIVMLSSVGGGIYLVARLYLKFNKNPVMISFQPEETLVSQIPYPAITICNINMLKTSVLNYETIKVDRLIKLNTHDGVVNLTDEILEGLGHLDHLSQFCLSGKSFRRRLEEAIWDVNGRPDFIQKINDIMHDALDHEIKRLHQLEKKQSFRKRNRDIFRNATIRCDDMLLKCSWAGEIIPCMDIFFPISTRHGHCCVFNMMPKFILQNISEDDHRAKREKENIPDDTIEQWMRYAKDDVIIRKSKIDKLQYPKHQRAGGRPYGLTVLANPNLHEYSTCTSNDAYGFKIVGHSSLSSPSITDFGAAVPPSSEVFVDIEPHVTVVAEDDLETLKSYPIEARGCYVPDDKAAKLVHYNYYSPDNCFAECWANHTYLNCSCVRYFMPRNTSQTICGAKKRGCADEVRMNLSKSIGVNDFCIHCYPPCTEILYKLHMSHFDMREHNQSFLTFNNTEGHQQNATNYSIMHFYMGTNSLYAKERKMMYSWIDLMANAGGLLGLTLGISLISFVEIVYFFTIRAWFQFGSTFKDRNDKTCIADGDGDRTFSIKKQMSRRRISTKITDKKAADEYYNWAVRNRFSIPRAQYGKGDILF